MEQLVMSFMSNGYLVVGISVVIVIVGIALYLSRNVIKFIVGSTIGYRNNFDDYALSVHKNREVIHENNLVNLSVGVSLKDGVIMFLSFLTALISPLLFAVVFAKYKYSLIKDKINKNVDYKIFDIDSDDVFIRYLNEKSQKVNIAISEALFSSYILIIIGATFDSWIVAYMGILIVATIYLASFLVVLNAYSYKSNYKFLEYFRVMRLLNNSVVGSGDSSFLVIAIIAIFAITSQVPGLTTILGFLVLLKVVAMMAIFSTLKKNDEILKEHQSLENRNYEKLEDIASYPNLLSQSRGYKFTTALQMKFFEIAKKYNGKSLIHVDDYAFYPQAVNRTTLRQNPLLKEKIGESVKVSFEALDFTKQIIILGGMSSGKTEMINYVVQQVHENKFSNFKAITYNDTKGDFSKNFYREDKDILVNLYDNRASVWCPFLEMNYNVEAGTAFVNNLFETIQGSEKDFFSASAKMKVAIWLQESYFSTNDNLEAWELFFSKIKDFENEIKETEDKTNSSIFATIQIALEILTIMHYQIVIEKRKTFTFEDYVNSQDIQLFLVNNKQYETKLTPYLNGLTATYINTIMGKDDTKEHLILNVFDEFLTMKIDEATRKTLLTATRSKGFCNVLMSQYLISDEKLIQDLDSSRYALITFNVNDDFTINHITKKFAEAEGLVTSTNTSPKNQQNNGSTESTGALLSFASEMGASQTDKSTSRSLGESKVITAQQLQSMPKYHHLTFIPSEEVSVIDTDNEKNALFKLMIFGYEKLMVNLAKRNDYLSKESGVLYLGYTPQSTLSFDNDSFVKWEMKKYYQFGSDKTTKQEQIFENEKEEFIHYLNVKFADTVENATKYINDNNLEKYSLKQMFENVEENSIKVNELMKKHSEQERYDLMELFFEKETHEDKYEFCKEHNLIGCILGIFVFSEEFRERVLGLEKGVEVDYKSKDTDSD